MSIWDFRFQSLLGNFYDVFSALSEAEQDQRYEFWQTMSESSGNKVGGYAEQSDPREDAFAGHSISLLQLEHDEDDSYDVGMNLFIEPERLKQGDFSEVLFYWAS